MAQHIKELFIHEYKGIHELKLEQLNSINILTGDNNSGKTSILELLSTVERPQREDCWMQCAEKRTKKVNKIFQDFYNMFPIDEEDLVVSYDYKDTKNERRTVKVKAEIEQTQVSEGEMYRMNNLKKIKEDWNDDEMVDAKHMRLSIYFNEEKVNTFSVYDFQSTFSFVYRKGDFVKTVYISPFDHASDNLNIDGILSDSAAYEVLIHILQEFDADITNINALKNENNIRYPEYMILSKKHKKALPLNAYGDGMKKAVSLLSGIVRARNGILLLDEFETAIHTSAMDSIFSWLLRSAMEQNIQVFMTSHSKEAIGKVLRLSEELQQHINLYTLYKYEGKNYVRRMSCEKAIHAQENLGLELR